MKNNPPAGATRQSTAPVSNASHRRFSKRRFVGMATLALSFLILHSSFCLRALGQSYSVDWYKVSGGGGTSTGGVFSVSGTIGQPDASDAMSGGQYSVTGGFWSLYAVQTPGAPVLTITHIGNQAIVSWSPSVTGWTLQTNVNLATPTWGNYLGPVVNNSVTNAPPKGNLFYRLKQ
jgi:hypothetical protein